MGKSKDRLENIKSQAFNILCAESSLEGARANAAHVLRMAGVHEDNIEAAKALGSTKREGGRELAATIDRDLARRVTALEERLSAKVKELAKIEGRLEAVGDVRTDLGRICKAWDSAILDLAHLRERVRGLEAALAPGAREIRSGGTMSIYEGGSDGGGEIISLEIVGGVNINPTDRDLEPGASS